MMFSWLVVFCIYLSDFAKGSTPSEGCGYFPIGLQHESIIPDSSFTSETYSTGSSTLPSSGRLHNTFAWMPEETNSYLQIDFQGERMVCGVATQGNPKEFSWVLRYKLNFSRNGTDWNTYKENGTDKIFQGNNDSSTVVRRYLKELQTARYIRFIPTAFHNFIAMRVEVFALDLEKPNVTPHQRSLQLKWGVTKGKVTSFLIEIRNKTTMTHFRLSNTTLEYNLTNLKPYTEYSIRLNVAFTNKPNLMSNWINVITKSAVPECSPVVTNIQAASSTSIFVAWQQDSTCLNGILRGYIIQYRILGNSTVQHINITDNRLIANRNVSGLRKYTKYSFRILAYTTGKGPLSTASLVRTSEDAPSCSPTLLSAQTTSSTSVRLIWDPPPNNGCRNGELRGFQIRYHLTSDKGYLSLSPKELTIDNPNTTTYEVGGLKEYTWYNFSILAYTIASGPWSNTLKNRTSEGAPSCSSDMKSLVVVNSTSILVRWTPLPTPCRIGILRGYKLLYRILDSRDTPLTIDIRNPNATEKIVVGLKKFSNYSFQVLAYSVKDGNLSKPAFGKTKEDVPECSPVVTNIQAASSTSIFVAWQQDSTCLNGILRGYIIQYRILGNSTVQHINITDYRLNAKRNVSGLRKYTDYSFRMLAYTIGEGPLGNASVVRTDEDAPSCSPTLLSAQATSSTSVRLTWAPPPNNGCRNGVLQGYNIKYGSYYLSHHDPHATSFNLTKLDKYTWYTFSVEAFTIDSGPSSNTLRIRTNEDAPDCSSTLVSVLNVSSTSLNVTWTPLPPGKCRNGVLRGYKVYYNNTRTGKMMLMKIEDNVTTTVNVTGLDKYTEYSIRVLGYTVKDSPLSNEMTRRTSEDAPDCSPEIKSTYVLSSTSIRVSWNRLSTSPCTNGMVRGYKVRYEHIGGDIQTYQIRGAESTAAEIVGLKIFTSYAFQVLAYTIKDGPPGVKSMSGKTLADAPSAPVNVNRTLLPANGSVGPRVEIRWDEPLEKNGVIQKYTLVHIYNNNKATEKKREIMPKIGQRTYLHTIDVIGETTFSFQVNAYTIKEGPYQHGEVLVIPAYPPSTAPSNISRTEINDTTFLLQWRPIPRHESNGNVTKYEVQWIMTSRGRTHRTKRSVVDNTRNAITREARYILTGLLSCAQYNISVRGYTIAGHGPYSTPINVNTSQPESPFDVLVMKTDATSVLLKWKKPANVIERIDKYLIEYRGHKTYMHKYKTGGNATTNGRPEIWMNNLVPATHYEFWVSASTVCGRSPRSNSTTTQTSVTYPLAPAVASIQQYHTTGLSVNVTLFSASQINGPISAYQVIVEFLKENNTHFDQLPPNYEQNAYSYQLAEKNNLDYYVTAEVKSDWLISSRQFTIGDNMTYSKFRNVPLKKGARYHVYQRALANDKKKLLYSKGVLIANITIASDAAKETISLVRDSSGSGTVVGIVVGLMLLTILVIFFVYFVWKRQRNVKKEDIQNISLPLVRTSPEQSNNTSAQEKGEPIKPIHVSKFAEFMASMRKDDFSKLLQQFKKIPSTNAFSCITARKPTNKCKNRYGNIVAYDHSRVRLQLINGDEDSDYINASFMHGYDGTQKTYIATQGPLPETINDFWRMIWEQNTTCIIMLTNLIELGKRKCHQYWPETSEQYGDITVKIHKTEVFADYHVRTLILSKGTNEEISRRVLHFHYTAWPDKGVPHNAAALLSFRRKVREMSKWNTGPTVVHCSAGVGRTGTYMIVDAMLEQVESKKTLDIYNYTSLLRKNRPYMVQTSEQYVFIHLALFEEITCGNTEIEASDLETAMWSLSCTDDEENLSGYALEFQRLEFVASYEVKEECGVGQEKENAEKNRYQGIIPANQSRVILSTEDSTQGDYINATFIDTHSERNAFIMTQAPMENTIADFWRMVMDYEIGTIVMLNNLQEGDEEFPQYWPQDEPVTYSGIQVELLETEKYDDILLRTFTVSYQAAQHSVQHLQYTGWDITSVPSNTQSLLDLLKIVWNSQQKCDNHPVVVQCSNGVGRSGTFCAIASCLERVKQEQVLDVFQTVKSIRVNRPGAVETLSQYEYCFMAVKQYLDSFSDYANFAVV